ncbi:hypothetical protein EXT43_02765 [Pseudoalteromonas sp. CO109Y]|uniref:hypothetical protein n=1 Tax=Pseudoalteromonas sp. CO109Y TaxID=1777235 RepID=UPI001022EA93|nr:hypothetical protein [Pseudoalteromonas sp. CO109Y]RZF87857.1 hypothetical protein EXT43_02765 [Pseudoalteromonas sp. CO109Y]
MKSIETFLVCVCLMLAGGIIVSAVGSPFESIINLAGSFGSLVGGGSALWALYIWKKQIHYNRKLEVIEIALKVQFLAGSFMRKTKELYLISECGIAPSKPDLRYHIQRFNEEYCTSSNQLNLALNELREKAAMYQRLTKDKEVSNLANQMINSVHDLKRFKIPYDMKTANELRYQAIVLQTLVDNVMSARSKFEIHIESTKH